MRISDWSSDVCSSDLYGISYSELGEALERANLAVGANYYNRAGEAYLVRVDARVRSVDEIRNAVVATRGGVPVTARSEERRVGKAGVSPCRRPWSPPPLNIKQDTVTETTQIAK